MGSDTLDQPHLHVCAQNTLCWGLCGEDDADMCFLLCLITEFCILGVNTHAFTQNCSNKNGQN